jgi:hypothetical protein
MRHFEEQKMSFEIFWEKYPRKVAKRAARAVFDRMTAEDKAMAIDAIEKHCKHWKLQNTEMEFIPHATTWLRQGRFEDEIVIQVVKGKEWFETATGIREKGKELGLYEEHFELFHQFKDAVLAAAKNGNVVNVKFG